ncbi:MAG: TerB family tellurite resistance protein [Polaromonas sp.]
MLKTLKDLFDTFAGPAEESPQARDHALKLATAVLLVEVMRADPQRHAEERQSVLASLRDKFALPDDQLAQLVELAEQAARTASDYHQFTSRINDCFSHPEKIRIVEQMWQVAYADDHLHANENHVISKIAGLLHVTHGEYIGAKLRAKEAASLA